MGEISENNEGQNKNASIIVECPHCYTKILPLADNTCPACQGDLSHPVWMDSNRVSLLIHESEELPSYCYSCNQYTEQKVRVSGDQESLLSELLTGDVSPEQTSNVVIFLPQCESCAEMEDPEPVEVDYELQTMTFVVHAGFRDRVIQFREDRDQNDVGGSEADEFEA
ncbi:MAG: hypothetical protein DPW18_03310 [Chloroflexi bacterium]|nr:hypothetical protein [Chloroflexota bacterium]MDL1943103.1 hypothetical protein [Chloroflexi bacterium CFX2]